MQKIKYPALISIILIASLLGVQCTAGRKESLSTDSRGVNVTDKASFDQALKMANQANREAIHEHYKRALSLSDQSLRLHENFEAHYVRGTVLYKLGRTDEALDAYLRAENLRPDDQQLLMSVAVVYLGKGKVSEALQRYATLHEKYPNDALYAFKTGTTYKLMGQHQQAYEYLKKAEELGNFERKDQLYVQLGDTALDLKHYDESEEYFKKAKKENPELEYAGKGSQKTKMARILEEGNRLVKEGKLEEALKEYNRGKEISPDSPAPYLLAGSVQTQMESYDSAIADLKEGIKRGPGNPHGYELLSITFTKKKEFQKAISVLNDGLQIAPEAHELYNRMGRVYTQSGDHRQAIDAYYKAVNLAPGNMTYRINLGYAYLQERRYTDAQNQFEQVKKGDGDSKEASDGLQLVEVYRYLDEGDRHLQASGVKRALASYEKARAVRDDLPVVYNSIGRAYIEERRYSRAEQSFQTSLKYDDKNIPALQGLLRTYSLWNKRTQMRKTLVQLQKLVRNDVIAAITLGRLKEDEGNLEEARRYYLNLLKTNPESVPIKNRLGYVYYKQGIEENDSGDFRSAQKKFKSAKYFNPTIPYIDQAISTVDENLHFKNLLPEIERAEDYFARERYETALPIYQSVYTMLKRPSILVRIASCYMELDQEEKGLRMLEEASVQSPGDIELAEAIYTYFLKKGKLVEAKTGFSDILKRKENAYYSHYKLGVIYLKEGNEDEAIESLTRSLIYREDFTTAHVVRGVAYYRAGNHELARRDFDEAIRKRDNTPLPKYNIGVMLYNDDLTEDAEKIFQSLIGKYPDFYDASYHLSFIYYKRGNLSSAENELRYIIDKSPQAKYYNALARVYEKMYQDDKSPGNLAALRDVYQTIIIRYSGSPYAQDSKEKLARLSEGGRIIEPYPSIEKSSSPPVLAGGLLIYRDRNRIHAYDSNRKQEKWRLAFDTPIRDLETGEAILVLTPGRLHVVDPESHEIIKEFPVGKEGRWLLGEFGKTGVVGYQVNRTKRKRVVYSRLTVYDRDGKSVHERNTSRHARFYYSEGHFYEGIRNSNQFTLRRLGEDLNVESEVKLKLNGRKGRVDLKIRGDKLYLFAPGENLVVLDRNDLELEKNVSLSSNREYLTFWSRDQDDTGPVISGDNEILVMDKGGEILHRVQLPQDLFSASSLRALDNDKFIYIGKDGKLHRVDQTGKEEWVMEIPDRKKSSGYIDAVYSLYR